MSVLYRTYRPQQFADVVGQQRVVEILTSQLTQNRWHHGLLFAGPKGVGKTSVARIFAKALNCQARKRFEPCNRCSACREITRGVSLFVSEIDGASHRGIDEIRALHESATIAWNTAFTRVYIIDEAHMLTKEAANALLHLLEEPPPRIVFILATTDFMKLPETVLSRLARLHFRRLEATEIEPVLEAVAKTEGRSLEAAAAQRMAELAEGSLRDGLNMLDELFLAPGPITRQVVDDRLGLLSDEVVSGVLERLVGGDGFGAIALLGEVRGESDHRRQIIQLTSRLRDRLFAGDPRLAAEPLKYVRLIQCLLVAERLSKLSPLSVLPLELALIEGSLLFRPPASNAPTRRQVSLETARPAPAKVTGRRAVKPTASLRETRRFDAFITAISQHNHALALLLRESEVMDEAVEAGRVSLRLSVRFAFHQERLLASKHRRLIEATLAELYGQPASLEVTVEAPRPATGDLPLRFEEALRVFDEEG